MSKDKDVSDPSSPRSLRSLGEPPSVRELEALEQKDRKETADLLSGFDRPGRTPRSPRVRDFVDYYSNPSAKAAEAPPPPPSSRREETRPQEKPTVLVPRKDKRGVVMWALAVLGMIVFGVTIAVLATPQVQAPPPPASGAEMPVTQPTMTPSSAATITSAEPRAEVETTADTLIVAPPPSAAKKPTPPPAKSTPRDDFIRDL